MGIYEKLGRHQAREIYGIMHSHRKREESQKIIKSNRSLTQSLSLVLNDVPQEGGRGTLVVILLVFPSNHDT